MTDSNILLFIPQSRNVGERLQQIVMSVVSKNNITIVRDVDSLLNIIRQPVHGVMAAVVMASNTKDLNSLCIAQDLLHRIQVILVLPDQKKDTISMGHDLRPRLISYMDSDFLEVKDVLQVIIGKTNEA